MVLFKVLVYLLRRAFPGATYRLLEDPEVVARVRSDPAGFLDELRPPALLDEIQNAPELLAHVRARIDAAPRQTGRWLLTGSQEAPLMRGVTESMAGRAALLELWPLSTIRDLATFRRFLALTASRCGQVLNKSDLAAPLGVSVPTITDWLGILEVTGQIILVPPFFENLGKRLVKAPKLYFVDSGLLCHLLGLESEAQLRRSPFWGPVFEGHVVSEIMKQQQAGGRRREVYFFRDQRGLEVDFLVPMGGNRLAMIEARGSASLRPEDARAVVTLMAATRAHEARGFIVHLPRASGPPLRALRPGVHALPLDELLAVLGSR